LDIALLNSAVESDLEGLIVKLMTGLGTNILCVLTTLDISPSVRLYPVEHYTPKIAKISPALT
jgi:hypothetical protein